jgi:hypothetical protein
MGVVLWRESWLKPLTDAEIGTELCSICRLKFQENDFVTSCEFCLVGVIHESCAREHILQDHKLQLDKKISLHRDKPLHDFQ